MLENGEVVEYTEMITLEMLAENPEDRPYYEDAERRGRGVFISTSTMH